MLFVVFMVAASFVHFQHSRSNVLLVLLFAVCNAACVASISMHLKSEKWIIYRFLVITLICVCALFLLTAIAFFDRLKLN